LVFLPRYSPDLNPRETDPRTAEATWRGIGTLLDRFKPAECANDLVNAGYASA
jgi:transposase